MRTPRPSPRPFSTSLIALIALLAASCSTERASAAVKEFAVMEISGEDVGEATLEFELWPEAAPKTVANFRYLAETGFYDGTAFHRLVGNFMIQGGDALTKFSKWRNFFGSGNPGYQIVDERPVGPEYAHKRGVISMANSGYADSAGSQFFIMLQDSPHLDGGYASFGNLSSDSDAFLTALQNAPTVLPLVGSNAGKADFAAPEKTITLKKVRIRREFTAPDFPGMRRGNYFGKLAWPAYRAFFSGYPVTFFETIPTVDSISGPSVPDALRDLIFPSPTLRDTVGRFSVSVTTSGMVSGKITYYGRGIPLLARLQPSGEGVYTASGILDSRREVPVRFEMHLKASGEGQAGLLTLRLFDPASEFREVAIAAGGGETAEWAPGELQNTRITGVVGKPLWYDSFTNPSPAEIPPTFFESGTVFSAAPQLKPEGSFQIAGEGVFSMSVTGHSRIAIGTGFMPDGRAFAFSAPLAREGARIVALPYQCQFEKTWNKTVERGDFPYLLEWSHLVVARAEIFMAGDLEIPAQGGATRSSNSRWIYHLNNPKNWNFIPTAYFGLSSSSQQVWVRTRSEDAVSAFPNWRGLMSSPLGNLRFSVSGNPRTLNFGGWNLQGRINPLDGVISGKFLEINPTRGKVVASHPIRAVLITHEGDGTVGRGHMLTPSATLPISFLAE